MKNKNAQRPKQTRTHDRKAPRVNSQINIEELEKLCELQCTQAEIASWFGVTVRAVEMRRADTNTYERKLDGGETLQLTFKEIMDRGYARGRISVRRQQMKLLQDGNATMGVWLGKQILGQTDKVDTTLSAPGGGPVRVSDEGSTLEDRINSIIARSRTEAVPTEPQ